MAASQADEIMLGQLHDRVGQRVTDWRPGARVRGVSPLTGGTSSLTFIVDLAGVAAVETPVVLKVAPPGLAPLRNRDVLRQARLQQTIQGTPRPLAPDVLFSDPGEPPEVPPFMAMNLVAGECVEPVLCDDAERPAPVQVRARFFDAVRVLAQLHALVPAEVGLGDEPVVGLADEVDRWTRAFTTLPPEMAGDYERAAKALRATMPAPLPPAFNHGDFRLGNTLCEGDRVNAVIDWEIWSVGDPRVDLSWLTYFTDDAGHPAVAPGTVAGTPAGREVVRAYEDAIGRPVPELGWFDALTRYKEAATTGLLLKRALKLGRPVKESMARMQPELPRLVQEAIRIVSG
ncbi:phosphotransferase family protein [Trebonia kvetii]|uniref:Phosphotransferase family protein n=2 Tax=Trebonia kvetii TaxID=2480626 RepID=A0A6P2BWZ2_9ACTN|nr:phosphotransferase family protein [Trebonia kvetii]